MKPKFNLENLEHQNVYHVPENYFDKLPNRIMQHVNTAPDVSEAKTWFPKPLRLALAGTGFTAIFATVFLLNVSNNENTVSRQLANVQQTEIVDYLLASEQLERADLVILNASEQDLTHEFISANASEIKQEVEEGALDENYL